MSTLFVAHGGGVAGGTLPAPRANDKTAPAANLARDEDAAGWRPFVSPPAAPGARNVAGVIVPAEPLPGYLGDDWRPYAAPTR